jgi:ribonucleoside-diphosphate reductase alpha chain
MDNQTPYQKFIYKKSYSRWLDDKGRREDWDETVDRYRTFMLERLLTQVEEPVFFSATDSISTDPIDAAMSDEFVWADRDSGVLKDFQKAIESIRTLDVMPSMRALWTAGPALERDNISGYNCAYLVVDHPKAFAELMYILLNGTGVGFSVERQYINKMYEVPSKLKLSSDVIVFKDSKLGWAEGYYKFLLELYRGKICAYDLSKIRPYGARLKTFGGRASGPEPLEELLERTRAIYENAKGRRLNSLECHDLCCHVADVVISGGVRRSACISLSNLSDDRMANCKSGNWPEFSPQRKAANNSVAYTEKPDTRKLMSEWTKLMESKSGERGIFNREAADWTVQSSKRRETGHDWGCNPCGEIILRPNQFCNLTEVVVRPDDTLFKLKKKVRDATILGCIQSLFTDFKFIGKKWQDNCEEERLLGVSLTGLRDHPILQQPDVKSIYQCSDSVQWLKSMKEVAIKTAKKWAGILGINVPAAICTVKPSGTVSQLVNSSSGLHARHSKYYMRRVRISTTDPMCEFLIDQGMPGVPVIGEEHTMLFEFPMKAPEDSVTTSEISAIKQLEYWKMLKMYWCEHNPSCTITVKDDEWIEVLDWVHVNWNFICGLSFFPVGDTVYKQKPLKEIDKDAYNKAIAAFPDIDFSKLDQYEQDDNTEGAKELSCSGHGCEV